VWPPLYKLIGSEGGLEAGEHDAPFRFLPTICDGIVVLALFATFVRP
jgi:hypothetical protein